MKIILGMMIKNYPDIDRWFERAKKIADKIIIVDNSDDGITTEKIAKYNPILHLKQKDFPRGHGRDYYTIYSSALRLGGDILIMLDADELIDTRTTKNKIIDIFNKFPNIFSLSLRTYEMWNDEQHYSTYRYIDRIFRLIAGVTIGTSQHASWLPNGYKAGLFSGFWMKHLGHMKPEDRKSKKEIYSAGSGRNDEVEADALFVREEQEQIKEFEENE